MQRDTIREREREREREKERGRDNFDALNIVNIVEEEKKFISMCYQNIKNY